MPDLTPKQLARERIQARRRALKRKSPREPRTNGGPSKFRDFTVGKRRRPPLDDPHGEHLPPRHG